MIASPSRSTPDRAREADPGREDARRATTAELIQNARRQHDGRVIGDARDTNMTREHRRFPDDDEVSGDDRPPPHTTEVQCREPSDRSGDMGRGLEIPPCVDRRSRADRAPAAARSHRPSDGRNMIRRQDACVQATAGTTPWPVASQTRARFPWPGTRAVPQGIRQLEAAGVPEDHSRKRPATTDRCGESQGEMSSLRAVVRRTRGNDRCGPGKAGSAMTPRLCGAEYLRDYKILVTFEDGKTGVIDLEH